MLRERPFYKIPYSPKDRFWLSTHLMIYTSASLTLSFKSSEISPEGNLRDFASVNGMPSLLSVSYGYTTVRLARNLAYRLDIS